MQGARGASLTQESAGAETSGRSGIVTFAAVAVAFYAVDVLTKLWAVHALADRQIHLIGDFLKLTLVRNPGAAFSTGTSHTEVFSVLAIIASAVVLVLGRRVGSKLWGASLGFLLAGILGNLTDRVFRAPGFLRGHVIDFFQLPHWPVFNVADICIDVAVALIIILSLRGIHLDGSRELKK